MKKVVFIGIRHSGRSSTIQALGKINNREVINEFWEKEAADIKTILLADQQIVITTCWSAYRAEEAFAKILHNANKICYFLPIQRESNNLDVEEIERHINLFPVLLKRAEEVQKSPKDIPWIIVFSKHETLSYNPYLHRLPKEYVENYISVSAKTGVGLERLWNKIINED